MSIVPVPAPAPGRGPDAGRAPRPVDLDTRRHYHRGPMGASDDRQRVLIVEDEPNIASFARMYLEAAGFQVAVASRGDEGLQMAEEQEPRPRDPRPDAPGDGRL